MQLKSFARIIYFFAINSLRKFVTLKKKIEFIVNT